MVHTLSLEVFDVRQLKINKPAIPARSELSKILILVLWTISGSLKASSVMKIDMVKPMPPRRPRLMVSDIVLKKELPEEIRNSVAAYTACVAGAETKENYLGAIRGAGFQDVRILDETVFPTEVLSSDPIAGEIVKNLNLTPQKARELGESVISLKVSAVKPAV